MLVDTHIHVWDLQKVEYTWLKGNTSVLNRNYALQDLEPQRERVGVGQGILVQAANSREDTAWMLAAAAANPWIAGIVGWVPLMDPDATAMELDLHYTPDGLLKGVRHLIHDEQDPRWLLQDRVLHSLGLLAARDIPYDVVGVLPEHIRTALTVAKNFPGLRMVFDHLNQPPISRPDKWEEWSGLMREAAEYPNFYVKISGLGTASGKGMDWTAADLEPCIEFALKYFGPDRCFCGGDWPVSLLAGTYERTWDAYLSILDKSLDDEDWEKVTYKNAQRFYNLATE